ncbi:AP4M, partial [Symbiodinium sp. KB8]
GKKTVAPSAPDKSIIALDRKGRKNEIFVDILERLTVLFNSNVLDDCNFHDCVNLDEFEDNRSLTLVPPEGEFVVMNYRISSEFQPPFRVYPVIE